MRAEKVNSHSSPLCHALPIDPHFAFQLDAFRLGTTALWLGLVLFVAIVRGRFYAMFVGVFLGIHAAISAGLARRFGMLLPVAAYLQLAVFVHFALLVRARLRPAWYRALVSLPANAFAGGTLLAWPWALVGAFGLDVPWVFLPYSVAIIGLAQSLWNRHEHVVLELDGADLGDLARAKRGQPRGEQALTMVQITDPHLGPFMSEARLRTIVERAVAAKPDLILLTGDLLTMESHDAPDALCRALAPLLEMEGRVFACRGNHDFEAKDTIARALAFAKVPYLLDEAAIVETRAGMVQIIGFDYRRRDRAAKMHETLAAHPRLEGHLRLCLLHDPGAFHHIPSGEADLVLSGHTHGGQVGLVSFGLPGTFISLFTKIPDHGFWAKGKNRLYVHRGTGHYGFPLRVGVPGEEGVIEVHGRGAAW